MKNPTLARAAGIITIVTSGLILVPTIVLTLLLTASVPGTLANFGMIYALIFANLLLLACGIVTVVATARRPIANHP